MSSVRLTRDLLAEGYTHRELAQQLRGGRLRHVRRGAYAVEAAEDLAAQHLRLVEATVRLASPQAVVSHLSAAVVHGLPVPTARLRRVQLTRSDVPGGKNRGNIHLYAAPLDDSEVVSVAGIRVTSLARTAVDVARTEPFDQAVVTGDAAMRSGLGRADLLTCLERSWGRPGMTGAHRVAGFVDGRSESPGESLSRVAIARAKLPAPTLQLEVRNASGRLVARADFGWEEHRTLGEFDGQVKYGRLLKPGEAPGDVVYAEKLREDTLRDLGWEVARWSYADLSTPEVITGRLRRAFARAARR